MENIIETRQLVKKIGTTTIIDHLDLKVKKGRIHGFLGPNGAGKSTTIRLLLGLMKATEGNVQVLGKSITKQRELILKEVGALVESPAYYEQMTAFENMKLTAELKGVDIKQIDEILKIVGLENTEKKVVKHFSLGMKQRLGIGLALIGYPKLMILDEPTNGLDPSGIHEIRELIRYLTKEKGITVLISSHLLSEIEMLVDDITIIQKGKLVFQGSLQTLKQMQINQIVSIKVKQTEEAIHLLKSRYYQIYQENDILNVSKNDITPEQLAKELVLSGIDLIYLAKQQASLEDLFLEMTTKEG